VSKGENPPGSHPCCLPQAVHVPEVRFCIFLSTQQWGQALCCGVCSQPAGAQCSALCEQQGMDAVRVHELGAGRAPACCKSVLIFVMCSAGPEGRGQREGAWLSWLSPCPTAALPGTQMGRGVTAGHGERSVDRKGPAFTFCCFTYISASHCRRGRERWICAPEIPFLGEFCYWRERLRGLGVPGAPE